MYRNLSLHTHLFYITGQRAPTPEKRADSSGQLENPRCIYEHTNAFNNMFPPLPNHQI